MDKSPSRVGDEHTERRFWPRAAKVSVRVAGVALALSGCGAGSTGALPPDSEPQAVATSQSSSPETSHEQEPTPGSWSIDFSTMPDGAPLEEYIKVETFGQVPEWNGEDGAYVKENVYVENGALVVAAKKERVTVEGSNGPTIYEYTAGRFDTRDKLLMGLGTLTMEIEFDQPVP